MKKTDRNCKICEMYVKVARKLFYKLRSHHVQAKALQEEQMCVNVVRVVWALFIFGLFWGKCYSAPFLSSVKNV